MVKTGKKTAKKLKKAKNKNIFNYSSFFSTRLSSIIAIILLLASVSWLYAKNEKLGHIIQEKQSSNLQTTPTIFQLTPTLKPTAKEYVAPTPFSNPDPVVNCTIHASCGGGSRQMKKSECENMICCLTDQKCGGPKFITKSECTNSYCCFLKDGTGKLLSSKSACDNYYSNINQGSSNNLPSFPPCTVYYSALNYSQAYYGISPEECLKWKNDASSATNNSKSSINCVVSYPCTGNIYTYQVDQSTCNFMQSGAASTCSTFDAIKQMQDIVNEPLPGITVQPVDYSIHMDPTPTCRMTPYGCY